eukprot:jgi/Tetstr1/428767/TSEL_018755.t1
MAILATVWLRLRLALTLSEWKEAGIRMRDTYELEKLTHTVMGSRCPSGECTDKNVNIDSPELTTKGMSAQRRRLQQQLHWGMCRGRSPHPYIKLAHILDCVVDIPHLMLRVIPQIFKFTVSKHCDAAKLQHLVLWIEKQINLKLTENKSGQSKTCTRKIDMSAESWPGDTCQVLLDNFVDILHRAIPLWQGRDMRSYHDAVKVWEVFFCLNYIVRHGAMTRIRLMCWLTLLR